MLLPTDYPTSKKTSRPEAICTLNSPTALLSDAHFPYIGGLQLHWCATTLQNMFNFQNSFDMGGEERKRKNNTLPVKFITIQDFFHVSKKSSEDTNKGILLSQQDLP